MVDTQRFAIWHPPGMPTDTKKTAPVPILPDQPQPLNKNIENLVKDFKWNDGFSPAKSNPVLTSRPRIQSVSSHTRPTVAPQQIHLTTHLSKTDEDDSESTSSEEEVVKISPAVMRKFSSSSPPKPILSSTPVNSNLSNTRPKPVEKISFAIPKETPKENENNLSQSRTKATEKPTSHGPKATVKPPSPASVPEQPKPAPGPKKPVGATEVKKDPTPESKPLVKSPFPIESRRITPPHDPKIAAQRRQEIPKPIPTPAPMLASSQFGRQPLAPVHDQAFVTHNGFASLDAFLTHLQDEALDSVKLSMMEASIRQFHFIAAEADVQLTRKLCSVRTANFAEKRQALIEEHKQSMEAQAGSLLADMNAMHDRLKEQQTMSARGLFDIPVDEDGWERPPPPSTVPWKTAPPPIQSKLSDSWKPTPPPPKIAEVPKPQALPPKFKQEPELAMPSFWKPSWDGELTEPSTPQVPPISRLVTVEDIPDDEDVPELAAPAPVPVPRIAKPAPVPAQPISVKPQIPSVADEPTPIWGQPWRKGKPPVSNTSSNQATKPTRVSPPLPPVIESIPTPPPVTAPAPNPAPAPAPAPSPTQTKPKTAKQLRAEKNRKGKTKAAVTATKEDVVEEQEEVSTPPPQQPQPPAPRKVGIDAAIDNMVNTGNFQTALEQINWAWR